MREVVGYCLRMMTPSTTSLAAGTLVLSPDWSLVLPSTFELRTDEDGVVELARDGLFASFALWDNVDGASILARLDDVKRERGAYADPGVEHRRGGVLAYAYR